MHFRLYLPADFPRLYAIEEICFQPPFRFARNYMRSLIAHRASATWIAEEENEMAGFAIVHWSGTASRRSGYIQTIEVHPSWRRRSIARELLRLLEESARRAGASLMWLHVDAANQSAIALYRASGYEREGRQENYYGRGLPADIFARNFESAVDPATGTPE